jgi:DNA-binding NarL/FixJ family response regulator
MVGTECGDRDFTRLPGGLPQEVIDEEGTFSWGTLHFRVSHHKNLYLLHVRAPLPLDGLSPREQEIARALGAGKTFKSVARQYDIAVSTVANHASRIYRKLGVYRREDLVQLVRKPGNDRKTH